MGITKESVKRFFAHRYTKLAIKLAVVGGLFAGYALAGGPDPSKDLLMPAKAEVSTNFGSGSTFMWLVFIAESIFAILTYMKTKSLMGLSSVVVVMIVANVYFGILG